MLAWQEIRNIENSLKFFLDTEVVTDGVTDIKGTGVPIRIGRKNDDNWTLPCIAVYCESETDPRSFIGSNRRIVTYLIQIEIYATNEGERQDLAKWVTDTINDGWRYYTYVPNLSDPDNPTKTASGWARIDFLINTRVNLGQTVDLVDSHRHRISINVQIAGS